MSLDAERLNSAPIELLNRVKEGDQEAWKLFFEDAYPKVRRIIRRRLDPRLRRRFDSVDIANSVMADFCAKVGGLDFQCYGALHAYLKQAAQQKLIDERRKHNGLKRNVGRDIPVENAFDVEGRTPTPSHIAETRETYVRIVESQPPREKEVLTRRGYGDSNDEITKSTGMSQRGIQRLLQKLRIVHAQ